MRWLRRNYSSHNKQINMKRVQDYLHTTCYGKTIHWELRKKFRFDKITKWSMQKPESGQKYMETDDDTQEFTPGSRAQKARPNVTELELFD